MIPKLISISGPLEGTIFSLADADITIGREPSNSICIADLLLSRQHCRITREGDVFNLYDLGSSNGTFVNGVPVKEQAIAHRDLIKTGDSVLLFICHEESEADYSSVRFAARAEPARRWSPARSTSTARERSAHSSPSTAPLCRKA